MKKQLYLLAAAIFFCLSAKATPGDTTWVQAHNDIQFTHYGKYDTSAVFPSDTSSTTYRKVLMIFTLGEYNCPAGATYCHQWDYTVNFYLMTKGGDTLELSRFITPYAGTSTRFPSGWKSNYVFDVTDFYPLLKDTQNIRINYEGYSWGFTGSLKFAFIEGTPARNVTGIQKIYDGYFAYGNAANPINSHLPKVGLNIPASTKSADLRFIVSGHGSDPNGCCEFMSHYYDVYLNGSNVGHKDIWRSDCGSNEMYPQTGTWVFERANWCPGDIVLPIHHELSSVAYGGTDSVQIQYENYTVDSNFGGYATEAAVFYHDSFNHKVDASMEDIIAPTSDEWHFRENPHTGNPVIQVKNNGSDVITSLDIQYNVSGHTEHTYTWTGHLDPMQDSTITLPILSDLRDISGTSGSYTFTAKILKVNGVTDEDATNDAMTTSFEVTPKWPNKFIMWFKTNGSSVGGVSETNWTIYDMNGNVMAQRVNNSLNTLYQDSIYLAPGSYRLEVTDAGCDGINWWLYAYYPVNPGTGYIQAKPYGSGVGEPMNGYFNGDFGCGFTQYFTVDWPSAVTNLIGTDLSMTTYPNPAQNDVTVSIKGMSSVNGTLQVIDAMGRTVIEKQCNNSIEKMNVSQLANGMYTLIFVDSKDANAKLHTRLLIAK